MKVTSNNFDNEVLKSDKPVLIDFYADWCGPCRMMAPVIDEISREQENLKVCKINIDEEQDLAGAFAVMSIPTLVLMNGGKVVSKTVGVQPKEKILGMLQ